MTDAWQGMLFGTTSSDPMEDSTADELRICALNVNSPGLERAQQSVDWLLGQKNNVLVLTEVRPNEGGRLLITVLEAEGFSVHLAPGWATTTFFTLIATRGFTSQLATPAPFDPRIVAVDLTTDNNPIRVVGVYGLTNGMNPQSSARRRDFQHQTLAHLNRINTERICVTGDLNVVEPDHKPHLPAFEAHDYDFYRGLLNLGLDDAYRLSNPEGEGHSWMSGRFGNQRLDHLLLSPQVGNVKECRYEHAPRHSKTTDHAALLSIVDFTH